MVRLGCSLVRYEVEEFARGVDEVAEAGYEGIELSNDQVDGLDKPVWRR